MKWNIHVYDPKSQTTTTHVKDYPGTSSSMADAPAVVAKASRDLRKPMKYILAVPHRAQHAKKKNEIRYVYRGPVEKGTGRSYRWHEGYSAESPTGGVLYPWMTKREAQRDAKAQGARAVFVRDPQPSITRHHATKKSPAQLQAEIDEELAKPAWAKGLDLSESRALAKRLGTVDVEAKQRRNESDRRAALPSLSITDAGDGIFVRVSSPGAGYGKYHSVVDALKAFQIPIGNAIPPNIFVPVHKTADKAKARTKIEEALRYAGYRA